MNYNQYFQRSEYFLIKGLGFSQFNASENDISLFHDELVKRNIDYTQINCSYILNHGIKDNFGIMDKDLLFIAQDIDFNQFMTIIDTIVNNLIFPAFYNSISIVFISISEQTNFNNIKIQSSDIHERLEYVERLLLAEQFYSLLNLVNFNLSSTYSTENIENVFYTPIEIIIRDKMEEHGLAYQPQVKLGRHYIDFLVSNNENKIILECDGRNYHIPEKDAERDKELSKFGYKILRLSGSEIFNFPEQCIIKINNTLNQNPSPAPKKIDSDLDYSQIKPVEHLSGPVRVLAPAGSGKTKVLINRIAQLLNNGIDENKILALAFNKEAAEIMSERLFNNKINVANKIDDAGVKVRTFHSFGYQIIIKYLNWYFNADNEVKFPKKFMEGAIKSEFAFIPAWKRNDAIDEMLEALRIAKMELKPIRNIEVEVEGENKENLTVPFEEIFNIYTKKQTDNKFLSFDDMIYMALRVILDNTNIRKELQDTYEYVLVDEYQDLTKSQLMLAEILAMPKNNLFIVGDDDQMIYGWRGAQVGHILKFSDRFKDAATFTLITNYRSSKKIIYHSNWLIENNQDRVPKDTQPNAKSSMGEFSVILDDNIFNQSKQAVEWIKKKKETDNVNWDNFAILTRLYEHQYPIAMIMDSLGIPHDPINTDKLFTKNPGRDLLAYMSIILHPNDASTSDYTRVLKRPNKYLSNALISSVIDWNSFSLLSNQLSEEWRREKLESFINIFISIRTTLDELNTPEKFVNAVSEAFGLKDFYTSQSKLIDDTEKAADDDILDVILSVSKMYNNVEDFYASFFQAINDTPAEKVKITEPKVDRLKKVKISTIHKTKGKEFKNVVYLNLINDKKNNDVSKIEEERRVCYVAVTRAINNILITSPKSNVSSFLTELIKNPDYQNKTEDELNLLVSQERGNIELNENRIIHLNTSIDDIKKQYPELNGEKPRVDKDSISVKNDLRIKTLHSKFPELTGNDYKSKALFFKSYFIQRRAKKLLEAEIKINKLNNSIQKDYENALMEREKKVKNALNDIQKIKNEIRQITSNIISINEKIIGLTDDLGFRELLTQLEN